MSSQVTVELVVIFREAILEVMELELVGFSSQVRAMGVPSLGPETHFRRAKDIPRDYQMGQTVRGQAKIGRGCWVRPWGVEAVVGKMLLGE